MLQLGLLLLSIVLVTSRQLTINNYVIKIENDTLISVQPLRRSSIELNLSRLGLRNIENDAFDAKIDAIILNLGHNYLTKLSKSMFSNLTKIKYILMNDNSICSFTNVFIGLGNLKSLNISNNPISSLDSGEFYGLNKLVNIFLSGTQIDKIAVSVYDGNKSESEKLPKLRVKRSINYDLYEHEDSVIYAAACFHKRTLLYLNNVKATSWTPHNCKKIRIDYSDIRKIELNDMGISHFSRFWYRMEFSPDVKVMIMLMNNNIITLTRAVLNYLPRNVVYVNLMNNKINNVLKEVIYNPYLKVLDLSNNGLSVIEDEAFHDTNITSLVLNDNNLRNIEFVKTLPYNIEYLNLMRNNISVLPPDAFLKIQNIRCLNLNGNNITILKNDSFRKLWNLKELELSINQISNIEEGTFDDFESLEFLYLRENRIETINRNLFYGLKLLYLDMGNNKLRKLMVDSVPEGLSTLLIDRNQIEYLEPGCFAQLPLNHLSLEGNKINNISKGIFYNENQDNFKYYDLKRIRSRNDYLIENVINPEAKWHRRIFGIHLGDIISSIDFTGNPIRSFMNGVFYGIPKNRIEWLFFDKGQIQHIQGGLFDDL